MAQQLKRCSCGKLNPENAGFCGECGRRFPKEQKPFLLWILAGAVAFIFLSPVFLMVSDDQPRPVERAPAVEAEAETPEPEPLKFGEVGYLDSGNPDGVLVAASYEALDSLLDAQTANDDYGFRELAEAGLIARVPRGTRVRAIGSKWFSREVRILDGEYTGQAVWIPYEHARR